MKLYSKNELKSSRIFFDKQPPKFFTILILFILILLIVSLWICTRVPKNYIVEAQGTITTGDNTYVGALSDGVVLEVKKQEGAIVRKGDVLFTISNGVNGVQLQALLKQQNQTNERLKAIELYGKSLENGINYLRNSGYEQEYYGKMEYYLSLVSDEYKNSSNQQEEIKKKELKRDNKKAELNAILIEQNKLIDESRMKSREFKEEGHDSQKIPNKTADTAKSDEVNSKIDALKSEIESSESEIAQSKQQLSNGSQAKQTKLQLTSELGAAKATLKTTLVELEGQIHTSKKQDALFDVKANQNGYIHFLTTIKNGMTIQKAQTVAEISENKENTMLVEAYIRATDRSKVKEGNEVNVVIEGVNSQKYGTLKGRLVQIDQGTLTQESKNGNILLYKCQIKLQKKELSSSDGEVIKAIKSMPVTARIVYERETYMDWILNMLNFKN